MLLGDILAQLKDEAFAGEALVSLGDLALMTRIAAAAAEENVTPGEFAARSVNRFASSARDEDWLTMIGLMSRSENPGQLFLCRVLSDALADRVSL